MTEAPGGDDAMESDRIGLLDIVGDGFFAGATGAAVVALFFLVVDFLQREPFFTPSLAGSVVLRGVDAGADVPVDLTMVAIFSLVHGALFVGFGVVCAAILSRLRETPDLPVIALFCFLGLELGFVAGSAVVAPGLAAVVGHGYVAASNVLAGVGMAVWLRRFARHPDDTP
jgi:hypothetical protein